MRCSVKLGAPKIPHRSPNARLRSMTMAKELAITAGDHCASIPQQRTDGMAKRRCLPFIPTKGPDMEKDLRDFLLGRSLAVAIEGLQHPSSTLALLSGQARIRRHDTAMQGGEQAMHGFQPVEAVQTKRNHRSDGARA